MSEAVDSFEIYLGDGEGRPELLDKLPDRPLLFEHRGKYLADSGLVDVVNIALRVGQPLLVTGEPGCGKTRLAWSVAEELKLGEPLTFFTRSDSRAQDLLYSYDAVLRFYDIQAGQDENRERAADPKNYINYEALGRAILDQEKRRVVLIDEIDKAPRDFPNDLLNELDNMEFEIKEIPETREERIRKAKYRPVVIITSNSERQLPLPFLRRCVFYHVRFPDEEKLRRIIEERLGGYDLDGGLIQAAVEKFRQVREIKGLMKKPATGELLAWALALHLGSVTAEVLRGVKLKALPAWQALLKDRDDFHRLQEATT